MTITSSSEFLRRSDRFHRLRTEKLHRSIKKPSIYFENEEKKLDPMVDSTFILRRLENSYSTRSVIPENSVLKFLDYLLEDFADEWLTKATFHYRWTYDEDIKKAGATLSRWGSLTDNEEQIKPIRDEISNRQISRLYVVGSNKITSYIIEESYKNILKFSPNFYFLYYYLLYFPNILVPIFLMIFFDVISLNPLSLTNFHIFYS